jgi:hypothetical protein
MKKFLKLIISLALAGVLGLAFSACQSRSFRPDLKEPSASGPAFELAKSLYAAGEELKAAAFRGSVLFVDASGARRYFEFEAISQKPDIFSFLALGPTGSPVLRFLAKGDSAWVVDYMGKKFLTGSRADLELIRLPVALSPEEFLAVLTGSLAAPPEKALALRLGKGENPQSEIVMWLTGEPNPIRATIDGSLDKGLPLKARLIETSARTGEALSVAYEDYRLETRRDKPESLAFPRRIVAKIGKGHGLKSLEIRYAEVVLGAVQERDVFRLEPPPGFELADL